VRCTDRFSNLWRFTVIHVVGTMRHAAKGPGAEKLTSTSGPSTEIGACDNAVRFTLGLGHRAKLSSQHLFGCAK
jgi:hypothetical protein